jgi:hypothetical protein
MCTIHLNQMRFVDLPELGTIASQLKHRLSPQARIHQKSTRKTNLVQIKDAGRK